jgi:hypothetical protein
LGGENRKGTGISLAPSKSIKENIMTDRDKNRKMLPPGFTGN